MKDEYILIKNMIVLRFYYIDLNLNNAQSFCLIIS